MRCSLRNSLPRIRGPFKRASLNLSVDAIVIFVLAFSMMGVGLFITKLIRDKSTPLLEEAFDISLLDKQPTSQDPLTIQNELTLRKGKQATVLIGFYNKGGVTATNVVPIISTCVNSESGASVGVADLPELQALPQTVPGSTAVAYKTILKEKTAVLSAVKYICLVEITSKDPTSATPGGFASKQVYLNLVS